MDTAKRRNLLRPAQWPAWVRTSAPLAPLWLTAFAVTAEGFPAPPWPGFLALAAFGAAVVIGLALLIFRKARVEVILYALLPLVFLPVFDEITTTYKTPFIFFCTFILSIGAAAYQFSNSRHAGLFLPAAIALALLAAGHAAGRFWAYTASLGIGECFLDYTGCPPLPPESPAWWSFFFFF